MDHTYFLRKLVRQLHAAILVLFDQLYGNAIPRKTLRQIVADSSASTDNNALCLVCDDTEILKQNRQILGRCRNKDTVSLLQYKMSVRNLGNALAADRADQYLAFDDTVQIIECNITKLAALIDTKFYDLHTAFGKGISL